MPNLRVMLLTVLAMIAFAGNSLLCRAALKDTDIDAASFTTIRMVAGAMTLGLLVRLRPHASDDQGSWLAAAALFGYAACFSFAYIQLSAATGALLLFGAVQLSMMSYGIWAGERLRRLQIVGLVAAGAGLVALLLPGLTTPPLGSALLMVGAGMAWAIYSLKGKGSGSPIAMTAGNFWRAAVLALILSLLFYRQLRLDNAGIGWAVASGAVTSGLGYAIWYAALPALTATTAATVQLVVPVITALAGVILLGESLSLRWLLAAIAVLCGIGLVTVTKNKAGGAAP